MFSLQKQDNQVIRVPLLPPTCPKCTAEACRGVCVCFLTQLLQGRDSVLVSMVLRDGGDTATHQGV